MEIARSGIILNTEHYDQCVEFYQTVFGLEVLFQKTEGDFRLTCCAFGGSYLMIETGGQAKRGGKSIAEGACKLRFNVADIELALARLKALGIDAEIVRNDWGSTINLHDPDGNRIGIRDEAGFIEQMAG
ncbi:VOC family protein [Marinobacterium arenosum]|uniref:VOC family protein n=1 Tax=Marinobacterium arenosum TaxID=2862496 RepID=UPI001C9540FA|nr:VOC family protein [Marinobacterium arenosum]MBY4675327.1 VOC family protein [Marinobacterium arenosum]